MPYVLYGSKTVPTSFNADCTTGVFFLCTLYLPEQYI